MKNGIYVLILQFLLALGLSLEKNKVVEGIGNIIYKSAVILERPLLALGGRMEQK